jgi:hypothetical protein
LPTATRNLAEQDAAASLNGLSIGPPNPDCGFELMKIGPAPQSAFRRIFARRRPHRRASKADARVIAIRRFHPLAARTWALRVRSFRQMSIKMHNICG